MTKRTWLNRDVVGIGEAMVEFAPVGESVYRRGFAGDTLDTCWHIAQIVRDHCRVGYLAELIEFFAATGIDSVAICRDATRSIGLYVISPSGDERSFSYWRDSLAARRLADDLRDTATLAEWMTCASIPRVMS